MKRLKFVPIILFIAEILFSQTEKNSNQTDTTDLRKNYQNEILLESFLGEDDDSELIEYLENLKRHPFDLNKVTLDELQDIPFLNSVIAQKIIDYRNTVGIFKSKRALLNVEGMTDELYEKIKIYLVVRQSSRDFIIDETGLQSKVNSLYIDNSFSARVRTRFFQELQPKLGFLTGKYEGARFKLYNQLNTFYTKKNYSIEFNITSEKDAGEKNIADFISGFAFLKNSGPVKTAVAGDYSLNFAQGIALWSSLSFSKGIDAISPLKKRGKGIVGYSSVNEVQFFRGGAVNLNLSKFNFNLFYSNNNFDATLDKSGEGISSFYFDGYHRSSSEIIRMNAVTEKLFGGRMTYEKGNIKLGTTYWKSKFSKPVVFDSVKQLFNFTGNKASMLGGDFDFIYDNINFYGEAAISQSKSIAGITALQFTFYKIVDLILSYRNYPENFMPVHSFGFGEKNGETRNEKGFYAGIVLKPIKGILVSGYFDQFEFPYRTFDSPVPTYGNDFLTNIEWKVSKEFILNLKYKNENKEESNLYTDEFGRAVKRIDNRNQVNARAGFIYQITDRFRLRSRYEYVNVDFKNFGGSGNGYLLYSDLRILPVPGLVIDARYIIFDTDNYESRVYEFENDIIGVLSNSPLYGKGQRWYLVLKYKPLLFITIMAKYGKTDYEGVRTTGSGNDEIEGDIIEKFSLGFEAGF